MEVESKGWGFARRRGGSPKIKLCPCAAPEKKWRKDRFLGAKPETTGN